MPDMTQQELEQDKQELLDFQKIEISLKIFNTIADNADITESE